MAFRLADLVLRGEIDNTRRNCVRGWLALQGTDRSVVLNLTGNCCPDLTGRHIRFEPRTPPEDPAAPAEPDETEEARLSRLGLAGWAWQQIGPTGEMTAARKVRMPDCSTRELLRRISEGEPIGPTQWKRCLYLEWYSQNGRVVIEIPDPVIEPVGPEDPSAEDWADEDDEPPPDEAGVGGFSATVFRVNEDGETEIEQVFGDDGEEEADDDYGLFSDELQDQLDRQARETDRALRQGTAGAHDDDEEVPEDMARELELMDDLIESGEGEPLGNIFKGVVDLPPPDSLDEQEAEVHLKAALCRMALFGIALNVCEHFTPKDAYRLLVEELCEEQCFFPELEGTNWVQHFDTIEHCEICQAQFEADEDDDEDDEPGDSVDPQDDDLGG